MKSYSPTRLAYRQSRTGVACKILIWVSARNRTSGAIESSGLWTGDDHKVFSIRSQGRTYYGAGNVLAVDDIVSETGVKVRTRTVKLSALTPEVQQLIRGYDPRLARIEMHRAEFDTLTGNLIEEPERIHKGWIDKVNWSRPGLGGEANCVLTLANIARALTKELAQKFSDASQKLVASDDTFFQYSDIEGAYVWWGEKRVKS